MSDRIGRFFLKERGGIWRICWYENRQTRSVSCATRDYEDAQRQLLKYAFERSTPARARDEPLAGVLARYYTQHAGALSSAPQARQALRTAAELLGDIEVSGLTRQLQLGMVAAMRARGYSDWTIQCRLGRIWAALHWARRDNPDLIVPPQITAADWRPHLPNREIFYTPAQLGALLSAASRHDHWWRFVVLAIGTAGREAAIRELTWPQVDMQVGRIALNPPGRRQTAKRRATVPIAPTLARELASWDRAGSPYVLGKQVRSREFFDRLLELAAVPGGPNAVRHTVRTWMAEQDVPDAQADLYMGHAGSGSHTGARYTHRRPEYLIAARNSVESLFAAVAPHVTGPRALQTRDIVLPSDVQLLDSPSLTIESSELDQIMVAVKNQ